MLILLCSRAAAECRRANSGWLTAIHQDVFVLLYVLDATPLSQNTVFVALARVTGAR